MTVIKPAVTFAPAIREAARLITEHGWVQNHSGNIAEGFCAAGAICYATGVRDGMHNSQCRRNVHAFAAYLQTREGNPTGWGAVPAWNDMPERTKEEVIAALIECAEWIEAN